MGGGLVIQNRESDLVIQNTEFSGGSEFYLKGKRYTGVLNILNQGSVLIKTSIFLNNQGDDAINIIGGDARVIGNYFHGNRDAIDFDQGTALARHNRISGCKDDGIDLGAVRKVLLEKNHIQGCGDKAISVGEGSNAEIKSNVLKNNNTGVAVKDGSNAVLNGNWLIDNEIALSVYNKFSGVAVSRPDRVQGNSIFEGNRLPFKLNGKIADLIRMGIKREPYQSARLEDAVKNIFSSCAVCLPETEQK